MAQLANIDFEPETIGDEDINFEPEDVAQRSFDSPVPLERVPEFQQWVKRYAPPEDSGDYDYGGAFLSGVTPDKNGHWPDTFKKPNHPTFSDESIYAKDAPNQAGHWDGDKYMAPAIQFESEQGQGDPPVALRGPNDAPPTLAALMSGKYGSNVRISKNTHVPTMAEVGAIPAPAIKGMLRYTSPIGFAQAAAEQIAPEATATKIGKGVITGTSEALAGFTTPENLASLAVMPQTKIAQVLINLGFGAEALHNLPAQIKAYGATNDPEERAKIATGIATSLGLPMLGLTHAVRSARTGELPNAEPSRSRTDEIADYLTPRNKADEIADFLKGARTEPAQTAPSQPESADLAHVLEENEPSIEVVRDERSGIASDSEPSTSTAAATDAEYERMAAKLDELNKDQFLPDNEPEPSTPETVRLYHGATKGIGQAGRDFTTSLEYAQGYADKANGGGEVWYVDVPKDAVKTHDEYGVPMTRVILPDELAGRAKLLTTEQNLTESRVRGQRMEDSQYEKALPPEEYQRQHEEEIQSEANAAQAEGGRELLDAIAKSGGLPAKNSPRLSEYTGELGELHEAAQNPHRKERIQYNQIFREHAPAVDELATRLRDHGFAVESPNDVFNLVSQRLRTEKPVYGTPALAETMHGEAPGRFLPHSRERGAVLVPDIELPAGLTDAVSNVGEAGKAFFGPSKFTPFRQVLNKWVGGRQIATLRGAKILRAINREVPNKARQRGITIFREAGGNTDLIRSQLASARTSWFRNAAKEALQLTPEQIRTAEKLDEWYDRKGRRALAEGAITGTVENYAPHVWNNPQKITRTFPQADSGGGKLNPSFRPGKQRVLPTLFDGDQLRLRPKTIAAGELAAIYNHSLERALADRHFVSDLLSAKTREGKPLAVSQQDAARLTKSGDESFRDYKPVRHWAFRGEDFRGDILVHPEHARHVEAAIRPSTIDRPEAAGTPAGALARRAVGGALRVSGFVKQNMLSLPGFHYTQEATEALGHFVNPLSVERIDPANPIHRDAMNHGLMVANTHGGEAQWMDGLNTSQALITKLDPVLGPAIRKASNYLFEHYIPSLKMQTYKAALNRNIRRLSKELESGKMTLDDVKYHTARQVNDAYGHLNYADMGRSENMQKFTRLLLLAPDFLEARARQAASGVAGLVPGQSWRLHAEQRMAFWTLGATFYVAARALNQYLNGNPDWRLSHAFTVTYKGREYTMRSVPEDVLRLITDTRRFALARLNPLTLRTGLEAATGMNYRGEKVTAGDQVRDFLTQIIPLGLKDAAAKLPGLEKTGNEDVSLLENLAKSLGVGIKRASRVINAHSIAREWMTKKGMPADTGTYPSSPYSRLRNALEDNNTSAAQSAYQALLRDRNAPDIIKGLHLSLTKPFTKSHETDKAMLRELPPDDRATITQAQQARKIILRRFNVMRQSAITHVMEQEAAKRHSQSLLHR